MATEIKKVALVTGAARGIGLAVAKKFLAEGWRVALLDIEGELLRAARAALDDADNTLALQGDVADAGLVAAAISAVSIRFGRLDALVNNAGVAVFAPLLETSDEDWNRVLAVNLTGPFLCTKAAVPLMREHGGAIVNITSISAVRASTLRAAYGTSKAGLAHLTKQLAVDRDGQSRAHAGDPRRLSRRDSAQPLRAGGGTCGSGVLPVQRARELHHRAGAGGRWRVRCGGDRLADAAGGAEERMIRSPDGAQRNPGFFGRRSPDFASLHPGYESAPSLPEFRLKPRS
jgi:NAD(P)-dependent dehydrogenase (short-subunit alcohol dehydrogenase family)